ncbi:endoglucanase [Paecilomyces variotii]|uniref:Endoglucanase n=1 Tax=Byssochlamys spectabilis TaxID=264951 RepID=A0A443HW03_BYSSP|nr:endoglucanase [Paecilomyces variotii]KAJ9349543.1 CAZyme family AA11 [Paecilomyces variotii]RWQ96019.1 endoglucanase [Paecilomyces variotii]
MSIASNNISFFFLFVAAVQAHMQLYWPPPFAAENNPHRTDAADPYLTYPYNCCGKTTPFPCKGYLKLVGTPQGAPVVTWTTGSSVNFSLTGLGNHYGGSCQVGFSVDNGTTWKVAKSFEGDCPHRNGGVDPAKQTFNFTVPADMPTGNHIFAWTWFNREQEFSMLCSSVNIVGGSKHVTPLLASRTSTASPTATSSSYVNYNGCTCQCPAVSGPLSIRNNDYIHSSSKELEWNNKSNASASPGHIAFHDRPSFLFADIDNGCETPKTTAEVKYPNPGPDIQPGDGVYPLALPSPGQKCGY